MIDTELTLTCTDNGKQVKAHVLSFNEKKFMDVAVNTVRVKLLYKNGWYAGSLGGYEFTIREADLPKSRTQYTR